MTRGLLFVVAVLACLALPAFAYKLVPQGKPAIVAKSDLSVVPGIAWNRVQKRPGRLAESWTLDGMPLNELTFYAGIAAGRPLFREINRRDKPLPRFAATMLAPDVVALFESSYRLAGGSSLFTTGVVGPATFAGHPGFRFTYSFVLEGEEVRRDGEATGAIIAGRLYLITFEAPSIHYFARNLGDYRAVVASARIVPRGS